MSNTVHGQSVETHPGFLPADRYMALAISQPTHDDLQRELAAREESISQLRQTFESFVNTNAKIVAKVLGDIPGVSPSIFANSPVHNESRMRSGYVLSTGHKFGAPQIEYRGAPDESHFGAMKRGSRPLHNYLTEGNPALRSLVILTSGELAITGSFINKPCIINPAPRAEQWYYSGSVTSDETLVELTQTAQKAFDGVITRYSTGRRA